MEKVLNQEEIDAMVRTARGGSAPATQALSSPVEPWDVRRAGQIGREQLQAITQLHEGFARSLTHSLGAYLRVVFAAALVSAEHLTYREFLQRIPETTYLTSCRLDPTGVCAALQLDLKVAFPIIDLLLGGEGRSLNTVREITDIEEQILDSVARIVCREWAAAWQALGLEIVLEQRLQAGEARRLMPPEDKMLSLSFEITMPDVRGGLNLAVPVSVSNALLRKISADWSHRRVRAESDTRRRLMRRLLDCPFDLELHADSIKASIAALACAAPGDVLSFRHKSSDPVSVAIGGVEMFRALPARSGVQRAGQLVSACSFVDWVSNENSMPRSPSAPNSLEDK